MGGFQFEGQEYVGLRASCLSRKASTKIDYIKTDIIILTASTKLPDMIMVIYSSNQQSLFPMHELNMKVLT